MNFSTYLQERFQKVFTPAQSEVLTEVFTERLNNSVQARDFDELKGIVTRIAKTQEELAQAQKKTELRVEELAQAQKRTELRVEELAEIVQLGFQRVQNQISALGSRWGIKNETMLRNTLHNLLKNLGYTVTNGFYGNREIDIIIRNGEHILLEVTSAAKRKDVDHLNLSAEEYASKHNIEPRLVLASVYISPIVMREIVNSPRKIEVYSGDEEEEEMFS